MLLFSPMQYLDTNIILYLLTGDDPKKLAASQALFQQIEQGAISVAVPDVVIAEVVYVLSSPRTYNHSRQEVAELLTPLLQLSHFVLQNRPILIRALRIYADTKNLDFADAYIVASMEQTESKTLFSYDHDFDKFPFITREEPKLREKAA